MKKILLTSVLLSTAIGSYAQNFEWAKRISGTGVNYGNVIKTDASGNVYVGGSFNGTAEFNNGGSSYELTSTGSGDLFIAKYDASGNFIWAQRGGMIYDDRIQDLAVDAVGNVYFTGYGGINSTGTERAMIVGSLNSSGVELWSHTFTSTQGNTGGYAIDVDASGLNVYIGGNFNGTVDFDPSTGSTFNLTTSGTNVNRLDAFILKLNTSGVFADVWQFECPSGNATVNGLTLDATGIVYSTGTYGGSAIDCAPGPATANLNSTAMENIFVSKLDANGNNIWAKQLGAGGAAYGRSIDVDASGNVYTTGDFLFTADFDPGTNTENLIAIATNADVFVSKLDANGDFVWAKSMGGPDTDRAFDIKVEASGNNVYITGMFEGTADFYSGPGQQDLISAGAQDIFVQKLDTNGDFVWAYNLGSVSGDIGRSIDIDDTGNIYLAGDFTATVDFDFSSGTASLSSGGNRSVYFTKWSQSQSNVGISDIEKTNSIVCYPNPTNGLILFDKLVEQVNVYELNGKLIHTEQNVNRMDLNHLSKGIYLIQMRNSSISQTSRLVVE
ncbi:MAG: SBBP repeat-containing protein [Crocinitomicaceae bacterium]